MVKVIPASCSSFRAYRLAPFEQLGTLGFVPCNGIHSYS
jgi:hypothetical protein